jgi:uncharacterized protein YjbI with pentapeptide repeats/CRP-like cAMP-binding protein
MSGENKSEEWSKLVEQISQANTAPLSELARIAGLRLEHDYVGADLSGEDLSNDDLINVNFDGANLSHVDLSGTNLQGAKLSYANLFHAKLYGVDLERAQLNYADLSNARLTRAHLAKAFLSNAKLKNATLKYAILDDTDLTGADLTGADLSNASLINANLDNAILKGTILRGAKLFDASLKGIDLSDSVVEGAEFDQGERLDDQTREILEARGAELDGELRSGKNVRAFWRKPNEKFSLLFGDLTKEDMRWMSKEGFQRKIRAHEILIHEDKQIDEMYIVLKGKFDVLREPLYDKKIAELGKGAVIGEISLIRRGSTSTTVFASATVKAFEDSFVLAIPKEKLFKRLESDIGFSSRFHRAIALFLADRLLYANKRDSNNDSRSEKAVKLNLEKADANFQLLLPEKTAF